MMRDEQGRPYLRLSAADYGLAVEYSDVGATTDPTGENRK
jgi:hypothetical protein